MAATINTLGCVPSVYEVVAEMSLPEHLRALWENSILLTFVKLFKKLNIHSKNSGGKNIGVTIGC